MRLGSTLRVRGHGRLELMLVVRSISRERVRPHPARVPLSRVPLRRVLVVPALVVAEATYFVGRRLGPPAEARFMRALGAFNVEAPTPDDFARIAELL